MKSKKFYSHGKLLLSGEYAVLDGAISLAIPTTYGQSLIVEQTEEPSLNWKSFDKNKTVWFENEFATPHGKVLKQFNEDSISKRLRSKQYANNLSNRRQKASS